MANNNSNKDNQPYKLPAQNRYMPILLWLFPLLLFNVGWHFFGLIDSRWEEQENLDKARQETEALAAGSEFSYCFSKTAGSFNDILRSGAKSFVGQSQRNNFLNFIENRSKYLFRYPFPDYELLVFEIPNATKKPELVFTNSKDLVSKRALCLSFEYLVRVNGNDASYSDEMRRKGADIAKNVFGGETDPEIMAETQRGKTTFSFYKLTSGWFLWDCFKIDNGDVYGFYLVAKNDRTTETAGKLLALRELRDNQSKAEHKNYGAFIPLFPGYDGVIANEEVYKLPDFAKKVREWVPRDSKGIFDWQRKGAPSGEITRLGDYKAYFHVGSDQSHAAVFLQYVGNPNKSSPGLFAINTLVICVVLYLILRGLILGIWPNTSLRFRFISTYFLAACLPLGLLIIASYGYIVEYRYTSFYKSLSQIRLCISQFDTRKAKVQEEYRTAFTELFKNEELHKAFVALDKANTDSLSKNRNEIKRVFQCAIDSIGHKNRNLPILSLAIIDERGDYVTNIGNALNPDNPNELTLAQKKNKALNDNTVEALMYPVMLSMRKRIEAADPNAIKWKSEYIPTPIQETAVSAYKTAVGNDVGSLAEEFDRHRSEIITRNMGSTNISHIHDYLYIDGIPRFVVFMTWYESSLDEKTIKSTMSYLALNEPNFVFASYKATPQGIKVWPDNANRHSREFADKSYALAEQAYFRNSYASKRLENMSLIAVPSKKYDNCIVVGGISHYYLELPIFYRICVCVIIIILALVIFLVCVYYSTRLFITPVTRLKLALDKVGEGKLDITIKGNSVDEFGTMCHEFDEMTRSLNERNKLATLISDHAIEAMSRKSNDESFDVETFYGTVLVSDIRNFTGMCEVHAPDQVTDLLNEHFAQMTKIVSDNGGRIYKYIGDAIEVVFADKEKLNGNSSARAFKAAVEMLRSLEKINLSRREKGLFEYKIGVGLSYGQMSAGTIGSLDTRLDYAIVSDSLEKAARLESVSRYYPEFPLIGDKEFVQTLQDCVKIEFVPLEEQSEIAAFRVKDAAAAIKSVSEISYVKSDSLPLAGSDFSNKSDVAKNKSEHENEDVYEIVEELNFSSKFVPGLVFVLLFFAILVGGIYFLYSTGNVSEKAVLTTNNQRIIEQMSCDEYMKSAFDIKVRGIAYNLANKINNNSEEMSDGTLTMLLDEIADSHKDMDELGFRQIFIRIGEDVEPVSAEPDLSDRINAYVIANKGYTATEAKLIRDTFRIKETFNRIEKNIRRLKLRKSEASAYRNNCLEYTAKVYKEPSAEIFGEKSQIAVFCNYIKNQSADVVFRGKPSYVFWLDLYRGENICGYYLCSIDADFTMKSVPVLLKAFSKYTSAIALKDAQESKWYFEGDISEKVKKNILEADSKGLGDEYILGYLNDASHVATRDIVSNIGGRQCYLYLISNCEYSTDKPLILSAIALFVICVIIYILWKVANGTSIINRSVAAKLWVALLIVGVIPVLTVIFVFGLFSNEYYFVKAATERNDMQLFSQMFEQKDNFTTPLVWNQIRKKTRSPELLELSKIINNLSLPKEKRQEALVGIRKLVQSWVDEPAYYTKDERSFVNFSLSDISVSGREGWSFCYSDSEDNLEPKTIKYGDIKARIKNRETNNSSVSYLGKSEDNSPQSFGIMMSQIAKSLLSRRGGTGDSITSSAANEVAVETGLRAVRTFFGDDTFIRISNAIDLPTMLSVGVGKLGFIVSPVPSYEEPEFIIVCTVMFNPNAYLISLANELEARYSVYPVEAFCYGTIGETEEDKVNRILLAEHASWISTAKLPVSTNMEVNGKSYLIEGSNAYRNLNALLLLSCPESYISDEINRLTVIFYIMLVLSLLIIVSTTRNIASDIITPINSLITGIKEVNKENFTYRIDSARTDELGALCLSFDKMIKGLDEKHLMSHMMSKTARRVTLNEGGENSTKAECVFLYMGIPDFSSWMAGLRDYDIFNDLKKQTSILAGLIMDEGGEIDKIMGEKMLAVFRVNENKTEAVLSACHAALRLIQLENDSRLPFPIAIGINCGSVITGFLGIGAKRDFTVIGDAVNVTARIEALAERLRFNRILISNDVYQLITKNLTSKAYGEVELKGKSQPMKVYQLT